MNENVKKYGLLLIKVILTLAFAAAGLAKLAGVEMMVQTFEAVGVGQWFRYVTGAIELGCAMATVLAIGFAAQSLRTPM